MAILAEKYAIDYTWYVDIMLNLIRIAGDYVSEEVWYRVIQIVVNRPDVQGYAAKTAFEALQAPACHENMVKVGGYILGEFGNLIAGDPRSSPSVQFEIIHSKYHLCSPATRCLLLSTYMKFINLFPEIKQQVQDVLRLDTNIKSADVEIQQRTVEYLQLSQLATADVLATVLEEMPTFAERESSILSSILQKKKPVSTDTNTIETPPSPPQRQAAMPIARITNDYQASPSIPASASIDLLGINQTPAAPAAQTAPPKSTQETLLDIFGDIGNSAPVQSNHVNGNAHVESFFTSPSPNQPNGVLETTTVLQDNHMLYVFDLLQEFFIFKISFFFQLKLPVQKHWFVIRK